MNSGDLCWLAEPREPSTLSPKMGSGATATMPPEFGRGMAPNAKPCGDG
jgi:hypothetical protein